MSSVIADLITEGVPAETVSKFSQYHQANPCVWKEFEKFALLAAEKKLKLGAKAVAERVRWEVSIATNSDFKFNNNYTAYYARAFTSKHPQYKGFFETRVVKGLSNG